MEGPRPPSEKEFTQVVEFLNEGLRKNTGWSIDTEYPTALNVLNLHNMRIIIEEDRVLSHAVIKPLIVKSPRAIFKIGAIGSVYTNEYHRGKGLSTQIMNDCINSARAQLCDFAILWTNIFDYYHKFGFTLAGSEVGIVFDQEFHSPAIGIRYSTSKNISPDSILRLYSQHTVSTIRNLDEVRRFLNIPETNVYTAWEENGQLAAFAIEGKGADLKGYIHEWGGSVSKLMGLFSFIRSQKKLPITVIAPIHSFNLIKAASLYTKTINHGYLGMIKVLNLPGIIGKIKRAFLADGVRDFVCEQQGKEICIGIGKDIVSVESETEFTRMIFGPYDYNLSSFAERATKETIGKTLPLSLWLWGWDSI